MQVELHFQPGSAVDLPRLAGYGRCAVQLRHPGLVPIRDVCINKAGEVIVITPAARGHPAGRLGELVGALADLPTACSVALSLAESLDHLHREGFRGGLALSWDESVKSVHLADSGWHVALLPPLPGHVALAESPGGFAGDLAHGVPELLASAGAVPDAASDSFSLGSLLFELLTGERLLQSATLAGLANELRACEFRRASDIRPDLPGDFVSFLTRTLGADVDSRPSLREWAQAMVRYGGRILPRPSEMADTDPHQRAMSEPEEVTSLLDESSAMVLRVASPATLGGFGGVRAELAIAETSGKGRRGPPAVVFYDVKRRRIADPPNVPPVPAAIALRARKRELSRTEADPVDCAVFAPTSVAAGQSILIQVFAHQPGEVEEVIRFAREADEDARRLGSRSLEVEVSRGTTIQIELALPGLTVDEPVQQVSWQGRATSVQFVVDAPRAQPSGPVLGKMTAYLEGLPVGHVRFKLTVVAAPSRDSDRPQHLGDEARRYTRAYLSYDPRDRDEVLKRVQVMGRLGIDFFQGLLDLGPGQRWERGLYRQIDTCDVFLLFWSSASRGSDWVRKEVCYALGCKRGDEASPPEIVPIPIEMPVPPPPPELAHLPFGDGLLGLMSRPGPG